MSVVSWRTNGSRAPIGTDERAHRLYERCRFDARSVVPQRVLAPVRLRTE